MVFYAFSIRVLKLTSESARIRPIDKEKSSCFVEGRRFAKMGTDADAIYMTLTYKVTL